MFVEWDKDNIHKLAKTFNEANIQPSWADEPGHKEIDVSLHRKTYTNAYPLNAWIHLSSIWYRFKWLAETMLRVSQTG